MTRIATISLFGCVAAFAAGCADMGGSGGPGVEFIAANSSTVLVDYTRDNAAELDAARQVAVEKCGLFGGRGAALESLNARGSGRERASFLCQ